MPSRKKTKPPRVAQRVLIDGLTADQDEILRTDQYRTGMLGRDVGPLADGRINQLQMDVGRLLTCLLLV